MLVGWNETEQYLVSHRWELHSRFLNLVELHLEDTLRDWEQAIEQQAQQIYGEYARDEFKEFHSDEYHERLEFRGILMNSVFSASFALFENQLMRICRNAQRHCGNPFSVKASVLLPLQTCQDIPSDAHGLGERWTAALEPRWTQGRRPRTVAV